MNKGMSKTIWIVIVILLIVFIVIIFAIQTMAAVDKAKTATGGDSSDGFRMDREIYCRDECRKSATACDTAFFDEPGHTITCAQHQAQVAKKLKATYTPQTLTATAATLTVTVTDENDVPIEGASVTATYVSASELTDADGKAELIFDLNAVPKQSGIGRADIVVKKDNYPDYSFSVLVNTQ